MTAALKEYISHRKQQKLLSDFGTIDYQPAYDYKQERQSKRR